MTTSNFSEFYDKNLDEGLGTAILGKLGTAAKNIFRGQRKGVNVAADFLKVFQPMPANKYVEIINRLGSAYQSGAKFPKNKPKVGVKDSRFGEVTGSFFGNFFQKAGAADAAGAAANIIPGAQKKIAGTTPFEQQVIKKIPGAADPQDERYLYKDKITKMDIQVFILTNGGKISVWNLPKEGTPEGTKNIDPKQRVYALGLDGNATKAFELLFGGLSYTNWLTSTAQADQEKEAEEEKAGTGKSSIVSVTIDQNRFKELFPVSENKVISFSKFMAEALKAENTVNVTKKDGKYYVIKDDDTLGVEVALKFAQDNIKNGQIYKVYENPEDKQSAGDGSRDQLDFNKWVEQKEDTTGDAEDTKKTDDSENTGDTKEPAAAVTTQDQIDAKNKTGGQPEQTPPEQTPPEQPAPDQTEQPATKQTVVNKLAGKANDPQPISQDGVEKGYSYSFPDQEGNLYVYKTNDGKYKLAYSVGIQDYLVKQGIIKQPVKGL